MVAGAAATCLSGCVYLPVTTQVYEPDCQVMRNRMELQEVQLAQIDRCANQGCVALVVSAGIVTAASVVVSGSIVVAGNIAYWLERPNGCRAPG